MLKIRLINICEARRASRRHEKANVLHDPVQAKNLNFNPYIYILCLSIILYFIIYT